MNRASLFLRRLILSGFKKTLKVLQGMFEAIAEAKLARAKFLIKQRYTHYD